jgi:hypothetical protein
MKKLLLITTVSFLTLATTNGQNLPNYVPSNGLLGWWPFNGNALDESGSGNNGTVNGATLTNDRFGNLNSAYNFDGLTNSIGVGNINNYNFYQNDFSISVWFLNNDTIVQNPRMIIGKDSACFGDFGQFRIGLLQIPNCKFEAAATGQIGNNLSGGVTICNTDRPTDLEWNNVVFTRNSNIANLYINGILASTQTNNIQTYPSNPFNFNMYFGARKGTPSCVANEGGVNGLLNFFKGNLDDIGVWNRALSQQEITALYNGNICFQNITVTDTLVINMGISSFNPVTYNNAIKIFPNPSNSQITINYGNYTSLAGFQLKIVNSLAQTVFQTNIIQQSDYLSLSSWSGNGLYFVHIIDPQGNIIDIKKIVLQ